MKKTYKFEVIFPPDIVHVEADDEEDALYEVENKVLRHYLDDPKQAHNLARSAEYMLKEIEEEEFVVFTDVCVNGKDINVKH